MIPILKLPGGDLSCRWIARYSGCGGSLSEAFAWAERQRRPCTPCWQLQDPQQKEAVQKILDAVNAIVDATDLDENGLEEMMVEVRAKASELESLVPKSMLAVPSGDEAEAKDEETAADALPGASAPAAGSEPTKPATSNKKGPTKPAKKGPTKPAKKGPTKPSKKGPTKPGKKGN